MQKVTQQNFLKLSQEQREAFILKRKGQKFAIWSGQRGGYWRPGAKGYTDKIEDAGIYTIEECIGNTSHCGPEKRIEWHKWPSVLAS